VETFFSRFPGNQNGNFWKPNPCNHPIQKENMAINGGNFFSCSPLVSNPPYKGWKLETFGLETSSFWHWNLK
jgi:hypothetical protein